MLHRMVSRCLHGDIIHFLPFCVRETVAPLLILDVTQMRLLQLHPPERRPGDASTTPPDRLRWLNALNSC